MKGQQKRRVARIVGVALTALAVAGAAAGAVADNRSGFGLRLDTGIGWHTLDEEFNSDARWSDGALINVEEYWDFDFRGSGGLTFGAAIFYRINPFVTLEVEGRGLVTDPEIESDYAVYWDWDDGRSLWNGYRGIEDEDDHMVTGVASINLLAYFTDRGPFRPFVSAGLSAFNTEIEGDIETAYAYSYINGPYQYFDFDYPVVDFDADTNTTGFNVGGGAEMQLNQNLALTFMVKYYHSESEDVAIGTRGFNYPELDGFVLEVDPSFWVTTAGVSFTF